jgi:protocatechuate 3,4-dioxygenase beta subunit
MRRHRGVYGEAVVRSFLFLCLIAAAPVRAQETVNSASVSGRVTDPQGAVVPGALVTARQVDTNVARETITDGEGRFRFPYLKVGRYEISRPSRRLHGRAPVSR